MGHWDKIPERAKSQKFRCSKCKKTCNCVKYINRRTVCDYKFCPYCGEPMEVEEFRHILPNMQGGRLDAITGTIRRRNK